MTYNLLTIQVWKMRGISTTFKVFLARQGEPCKMLLSIKKGDTVHKVTYLHIVADSMCTTHLKEHTIMNDTKIAVCQMSA